MMLTIHALGGLTIAKILPHSIPLAFAAGVVSHLILDSIPHGDSRLARFWHPSEIWKFFVIGFADASIAVVLLAYFFTAAGDIPPLILAAGFVGALLPDFLEFSYRMMHQKGWSRLLRWWHYIHGDFAHCALFKKDVTLSLGACIQFITFIILGILASYA